MTVQAFLLLLIFQKKLKSSYKDVHIKPVLEYALDLAHVHVNKIAGIFRDEVYPVPYGFKLEEDVDLTAPRLFSDL